MDHLHCGGDRHVAAGLAFHRHHGVHPRAQIGWAMAGWVVLPGQASESYLASDGPAGPVELGLSDVTAQ